MSKAAWEYEQSLIQDAIDNPPATRRAFVTVQKTNGQVVCGRVTNMYWSKFYYRWMFDIDCFNDTSYSTHPEDKIERAIFTRPELKAYIRVYHGDAA